MSWRSFHGSRAPSLNTLLDWHEHDGYIVPSEHVDSAALDDALADTDRFVAWSSDDTSVRRAWYPPDFGFLLRWCVSSEPDDWGLPYGTSGGQFDITGPRHLINRLALAVPESEIIPAKDYFDEAYRG